jgi:hypothetical protein
MLFFATVCCMNYVPLDFVMPSVNIPDVKSQRGSSTLQTCRDARIVSSLTLVSAFIFIYMLLTFDDNNLAL